MDIYRCDESQYIIYVIRPTLSLPFSVLRGSVDGLMQERRNSIANVHLGYAFLALTHRYVDAVTLSDTSAAA